MGGDWGSIQRVTRNFEFKLRSGLKVESRVGLRYRLEGRLRFKGGHRLRLSIRSRNGLHTGTQGEKGNEGRGGGGVRIHTRFSK